MRSAYRQPKWIVAGVVVALAAALFVRLGFWQLSRLEDRRLANEITESRLAADPVPLNQLLGVEDDDLDSLEYRRATAVGEWDVTEEVLIRSQVELGNAGFHVITPLVVADGTAVLVNRGWVPLTLDDVPVEEASPPTGLVETGGWVHLTETRPPLGPEEPEGDLDVFNRVDIGRIGSQMPYPIAPVYLVAAGEGDQLPIPVDPPDFSDEGPHLAYAIQWFGFAIVGLVGFYFLARRKGGQGR
ncbi:MAG TPA: SURF1 family protein [Acidimicrobiia bacterium]